jgi:hypothetical protein
VLAAARSRGNRGRRARLEGSVIGENARVSRDHQLPRALRLSVGAEARLSLT